MANFELDPEFFLPPGHNIIDGGVDRLPRTYTRPAVPITRRHERFVIATVHPAPPADEVIQTLGLLLRMLMTVAGGRRLLILRLEAGVNRLLMEETGNRLWHLLRLPMHLLLFHFKTRNQW
ncbi:hypothetical protein D1007_13411 [Hordeum vulgare]|nr:hypothetical protein D1007_13411 [Hordeum vulgare]